VAELVSLVRDHLAERRATFGEHDLIAEALNRGMGKVSLSELEVAIHATGVTEYMNLGGTIEIAQRIAGHTSPSTHQDL
jgi:hypothetical protein